MKILIIGDTSGNIDEGMKKVSYRICEMLNNLDSCDATFLSIKDAIKQRRLYKEVKIIHFMTGPTWRTFLYARLLKLIVANGSAIIISFIHPTWTRLTSIAFALFTPNAVIIQSNKWLAKVKGKVKYISRIPLAGVNLKKFHSISAEKKALIRANLNLPLDKTIVLHVGHLNVGRNLSVFKQFKGSDDIYPLVIGSSTVSADPILVDSLSRSGVHIINEYLPRVEEYYMVADCYLFPTSDSNYAIQIPLSVLEALACNIPVISTPFEALPDYLPANPPMLNYVDSFDDLENKIKKISSDATAKFNSEIGSVLDRFDWQNIADNMYAFYKLIASGNENETA
jgi:glycosyltransferase involved in cell wall biosynthesis